MANLGVESLPSLKVVTEQSLSMTFLSQLTTTEFESIYFKKNGFLMHFLMHRSWLASLYSFFRSLFFQLRSFSEVGSP
jgi:hypothetical protein